MNCRRLTLFAFVLAGSAYAAPSPIIVEPDRAWSERFRLANVEAHYGLNYWGKTFQVALFMLENGPRHNEMGHDNMLTNLEAYVCPSIGKDCRRLAAATIAQQKALSSFVLSDPLRRREFFRYFATFYHAGGPARDPVGQAENNANYAKTLDEVWKVRAVGWMRGHGFDRTRTNDNLVPFVLTLPDGSGTVWSPPEP